MESGFALPDLPSGVTVTLQPADPLSLVTITGGGPDSNYGFVGYRPTGPTDTTILVIKNITFSGFYTDGNGAIVSFDTSGAEGLSSLSSVSMAKCIIEDVGAVDGGVVFGSGNLTMVEIDLCKIDRVSADGSGGVVHVTGNAAVNFKRNTVANATAGLQGGVLFSEDAFFTDINRNIVSRSHAISQLGGLFFVFFSRSMIISNNQLHIPAQNIGDLMITLGGHEAGIVEVNDNTFIQIPQAGAAIDPRSGTPDGANAVVTLNSLSGSLDDATVIATLNVLHSNGGDCVADPVGTGYMVESGGGNVTNDSNCPLDDPLDAIGVDLAFETNCIEPYCYVPAAGNPAIDIFDEPGAQQSTESSGTALNAKQQAEFGGAPCGYSDIRGLARPQDGDGDGLFGCDAGAYEVQGGPDIGPAQSGAYFDLAHNGEGYFAEVLDNDLLFMAVFTYLGDGSGPAWYVGLGTVFGNGFVVDDLLLAKGGVFGEAFDASAITRTTVAGFSANFPTCEAADSPGRWVIDPVDFIDQLGDVSEEELASLLEEQTQVSTRLSQIVPCPESDETASESAFRSGSYFDLARSGEGIFVEVLTNGQILVIWYTFDPQGNQMWIIAQGSFDGTTATLDALYPTSFTPFGSQFDPDQVVLSPWGTFTLSFDTCNSLEFSYDSTAPGYGSGSLNYTRLTQLAGTQCP